MFTNRFPLLYYKVERAKTMETFLEIFKTVVFCGLSAIFFQIGVFFFVITVGHSHGIPEFPVK
jgi:hypothetical protein